MLQTIFYFAKVSCMISYNIDGYANIILCSQDKYIAWQSLKSIGSLYAANIDTHNRKEYYYLVYNKVWKYSVTKDKWTESVRAISCWWPRSLQKVSKKLFKNKGCMRYRTLYLNIKEYNSNPRRFVTNNLLARVVF